MNGITTTQPGTVGPGQIQFLDRISPPLKASATPYELTVGQDIVGLKDGKPAPHYPLTQQFTVAGPRFALDPAAIHTVFPPANQTGLYHNVLPAIVFNDFALPWSRNIDPAGGDESITPWMALLTLCGDELPDGTQPKLTLPATIPVAQLVTPEDAAVLPPAALAAGPLDPAQVSCTDMDLAFFRQIAPKQSELPYLAHARIVNTAGKVLLGMDDDGCFSLVTGNRVPLDAAKNTVLLVSLEGHQDHLPGGPAIPSTFTKIRLVVLGSWTFTAQGTPGDFLTLLAQLKLPQNGGVQLLQLTGPADAGADAMIADALKIGYVALANDLRDGETATALYRGPLVPAPTIRDRTYGPFYFSDHAIFYDPDYGIFNHGYACAWQIGRLLGLSDAAFVQMLTQWRRAYAASQQSAATTRTVRRAALALGGPAAPAAGLTAQMRNFFAERVAPMADTLPTVVPRAENPALWTLPGASPRRAPRHALNALAVEAEAEDDADPLALLRQRLRGETT